jgi:hypothetical protein
VGYKDICYNGIDWSAYGLLSNIGGVMKRFLVLIFPIVLTSIFFLLNFILVINLIENWVLQIIIMFINTILFMYGVVYTGIDDYSYDNESQQEVINKCKILKSKIINLLFGG